MEKEPTFDELQEAVTAWQCELMDHHEHARIALEEAGDSTRLYGYSPKTLFRIYQTWKSGKRFHADFMDWTVKATFPHERAYKAWMARLNERLKG